MDTKSAYDLWSNRYDSDENKTRDLEAKALRSTLDNIEFADCLEVGCGTGKNTGWLLTRTNDITAVDLSEKMIAKAKEKINSNKVNFIVADINKDWDFTEKKFGLISFSLVLEHIENLDRIFKEASRTLIPGGHVYIGELHPFKQYGGTKARFKTEEGLTVLNCYNHHISDFINAAKRSNLEVIDLNEFFDKNDRTSIPRVLTILFKKA